MQSSLKREAVACSVAGAMGCNKCAFVDLDDEHLARHVA